MFWHDIRIESAGNIKNGTGLTIERTEVYWSYYRGKDHVTMIRFMNKKQTFPAQDETVLPECLHFIGASLKELGIYPIINMLNTMSNTTGDEAVSLVVGKMEDLVDTEVYDS